MQARRVRRHHLAEPSRLARRPRLHLRPLRGAAELARIFYPRAAAEVRRLGRRRVPYEILGINPPRDLAFKMVGL
jgi:hypothetical protein